MDNKKGDIEGYLGGVDLAKGRFDNKKHNVFEMDHYEFSKK
jgi:hypothetical protein